MKKYIVPSLLLAFSFVLACSQNTSDNTAKAESDSDTIPTTTIKFEEKVHDYGTIERGGDGTYEFIFANDGKEPLILTNVKSSCGCTVPKWPQDPIAPGETGKIAVKYNTNIIGAFSKSIVVHSNAKENAVVLKIKGKVEDSSHHVNAAAPEMKE